MLRRTYQSPFHGVLPNIFTEGKTLIGIPDAPVIVTRLPDLVDEAKFLLCSIGETTLDQLHGSFQGRQRSHEQMKMIWHHGKFMEQVITLLPIVEENVNEELGHPIGLQETSFLKRRGRDEIASVSGRASRWCSHKAPRRLKAASLLASLSQR